MNVLILLFGTLLSGCLFSPSSPLPVLENDAGDNNSQNNNPQNNSSPNNNSCECEPEQNQIATCVGPRCELTCAEGFADCSDAPGCETLKRACGCSESCEFPATTTEPNATAICADESRCVAKCDEGWVDADREFENGCEAGCVPVAGPDAPGDGLDSNCDGIDGDLADNNYFVDFDNGSSDGEGTIDDPSNYVDVLALADETTVLLRGDGVLPSLEELSAFVVVGGYDQNWLSTGKSIITNSAFVLPALSVVASTALFANIRFRALPVSGDFVQPENGRLGFARTAVVDTSIVTFRDCEIVAADVDYVPPPAASGADGQSGADGTPPLGGAPGNGGAGATTAGRSGGKGGSGGRGEQCPDGRNTAGRMGAPGSGGAEGGAGGSLRRGNCGDTAIGGAAGSPGAPGSNGELQVNAQKYLEWVNGSPQPYQRPIDVESHGGGGGGGGGGSGGGSNGTGGRNGLSGSGGGGGGSPGEAGEHGIAGLSTVAIVVTSGAEVVFEGETKIYGGRAGNGGPAGVGGCGGPGGDGGKPNGVITLAGGVGGSGGAGGFGAHGAGGNGGLSIGILEVVFPGMVPAVIADIEIGGGQGGTAAVAIEPRECFRTDAIPAGKPGFDGEVRGREVIHAPVR